MACAKSTYQFLFDNCYELFQREFQTVTCSSGAPDDDVTGGLDDQGPSSLSSLEFWHQLIALVASIVDEDQTSYTPVFNQLVIFCVYTLCNLFTNIYILYFVTAPFEPVSSCS